MFRLALILGIAFAMAWGLAVTLERAYYLILRFNVDGRKMFAELQKLIDVEEVTILSSAPFIERQVALVKVRVENGRREELVQEAKLFGAAVATSGRRASPSRSSIPIRPLRASRSPPL
jgi:hypothetical protein